VIEPQFFGGILNERKPYTFIRGCATDIFMLAINAKNREYNSPAEIDFLHRSEMCLWLPIGELWPELGGGFQSNSRGDQSGTSALSNAAGVGTEMVSGLFQ
jgi:hypothetical protein